MVNQGLVKALEAINTVKDEVILVAPDFGCSEAFKELTDWNDLINQRGFEYTKALIEGQLSRKGLHPGTKTTYEAEK